MYKTFYGLHDWPFSITPDRHFFVHLSTHLSCFKKLQTFVGGDEAMALVTGDIGAGKTLMSQKLIKYLKTQDALVIELHNPILGAIALQKHLAQGLQIKTSHYPNQDIVALIYQKLVERFHRKQLVILIIDEAQNLPEDTLEAVRILTNLVIQQHRLLKVVFFAESSFIEKLQKPNCLALWQRVSEHVVLENLSLDELAHYVHQRLVRAGYHGADLLSSRAYQVLYQWTAGVPRLVNRVMHPLLEIAAEQQKKTIDHKLVMIVAENNLGKPLQHKPMVSWLTPVGVAASFAALTWWYWAAAHS